MVESLSTSMPTFRLDEHGFPFPGAVIRYYRERMTYTDNDGNVRRWTQADLAKRLNVSEITVRLMETQNKYLTFIERRKTIAMLLNIPPALLGLASLAELQSIMQGGDPNHIAGTPSKSAVDPSEIQFYKDALPILKHEYDQGELAPETVESWITRITGTVEHVHGKPKNEVLAALANYHIVAANAYSHDLQEWTQATKHLNTAKKIASTLNNNELLAIACHHAGGMYGSQQNFQLARNELDYALYLAKSASPQVKGNILTFVTQAHALTCVDEADRLYVRQLLSEAEKHVSEDIDSNTLMKFDIVQYLENKADTLISLKRYGAALECIDEAEEYFITTKRGIEYLKILRAECYVKQRKPEYERATELLTQIFEANTHIQYYVDYVTRLYKLIAASPYGKAPDVVDLGMALRELKTKK